MPVARWPNTGYEKIAEIVDPDSDPRNYQPDILPSSRSYVPPEKRDDPWRGFVFNYLGDRPNRWTNADDVWLFGFWYYDWADGIVQISKIDTIKKEISTLQASWYGVRKDQRFYMFNLLEEIDSPGEWYLERKTGILYFYSPTDIENTDIKLSMLKDPLVVMTGSDNILFEKITFNASRGHGVQIFNGINNLITDCTFRRLGLKAVVIGNDNPNSNDPAIDRASNNLIHDAPHSAIRFSGNDHIIEYNEIHHVNLEVDDAMSSLFWPGLDLSR